MNKRILVPLLLSLLVFTSCGKNNNNPMRVTAETAAAADASEKNIDTEKIEDGSDAVQMTEEMKEDEKNLQNKSKIDVDFGENVRIIGDSIALGYGAYQRVPAEHVFAKLNVAPSTVRDFTFEYNKRERTVLGILDSEMPEYIMISMGVNDIETYSGKDFAEKYMGFVRDVRVLCPDAQIYVMALTPVMNSCEYTNNTAVNGYNKELKAAVEAENDNEIIFVDAPSELYDDLGCLKDEYSSGDGMHLTGAAYDVLLENISSYIK